jgi:hypothetical protein
MGNCLRQPGQLCNQPQKSMQVKFNSTYQPFGTMTTPATGTKSIGLPANAQLSWFLHRHLDNFIVTRQLRAIYRDYAIWTTLP